MGQNNPGAFFWILIVLTAIFAIFCFVTAFRTSKARSKAKKEQKNHEKQLEASFQGLFYHFYGLPLSESVEIRAYWCNNRVVFESNGTTYNLPFGNLIDVCIKSDVEIQKQYISNAGKAVAGAMVFGPIGAIIGGRAKEKETRQVTPYLIFTYKSKDGNEIKYVALRILSYNVSHENRFIAAFNELPKKQNISFDL